MSLYPAAPPPIEALSPDLQFKLWERERNRLKRSWLLTLIVCSPAIAFVAIKPINDGISTIYRGVSFLHWITGLVTPPPPGSGAATIPAGTAGLSKPEQVKTAEKIIQAGVDRGLDREDIKLALMAAYQESTMQELEHGDDWYFAQWGEKSDSVGAFQQRTDWGDRGCRIDATCSANLFYDELLKISDRRDLPEWKAIALVQRPAAQYEQHYQQWEGQADELLKAIQTNPGSPSGSGFPLPGHSIADIRSGYGSRIDPQTGAVAFHYGIDIPADIGAPIMATQAGEVITAQMGGDGCGGQVEIKHEDGNGERICHASELLVQVGDRVAAGQAIAKVGSTGKSTGPHLHFERIEGGASVDPVPYLKRQSEPKSSQVEPQSERSSGAPASFVSLQTTLDNGSKALCSAFAVAPDKLVTAKHCLQYDDPGNLTAIAQSGEWLKGRLISSAEDAALILVEGASFTPATLGAEPQLGAKLQTWGHPEGAKQIDEARLEVASIRENIIKAKPLSGRVVGGFSGGAVVDSLGEVVGFNSKANPDGEVLIQSIAVVKQLLNK